MRDGLKKRIQFNPSNPSRLNYIKNYYIAKNTFNSRIGNPNCFSNGCANVQDASGFWVGSKQQNQQTSRNYYAPFRQPVKGYRKTIDCSGTADNNCMFTTEIYKDTWTDCSGSVCANNGSISTSKVPLAVATRASSGYTTRTARPIIRSGMQPNVAGQQNSGLVRSLTATHYSYSYRELINNRRKDTYMKKLATEQPSGYGNIVAFGYGGDCSGVRDCGPSKTIYKLNNDKFKVQGAVESSSRIERLKLDTIRAQSNCPPGTQTGPANDRRDCNGIYRPGHMASTGTNTWPLMDPEKMGCKSQVKYTYLFNNNHTEVNYPQTSALARARGAVSFKTTANPNGGVCCSNLPPQFLL